MNKTIFKTVSAALILAGTLFVSCENTNYSVFNGGTGGLIVDAESTSVPKQGIANVDIYAYTSSSTRDSDFRKWQEGTVFSPSNSYYGHTTTAADGSFVISNIVWKETKPAFGKDADYTTIYLIYYHENYGLTKDSTVITSDSTSDTVYAELTTVRKTTNLNISIYDVSSSSVTTNSVLVKVSVPQSTDTITAAPRVYEQTITGTGVISVNYPRWKNDSDKANGIENTPQISIRYSQSSDAISWKACAHGDNAAGNFAFLDDNFQITKTIQNSSYNVSLYGKPTRIRVPVINGRYGNGTSASNDGVIISMKAENSSGTYSIDCGETTTYSETLGSSSEQSHGNFSGLGEGHYIIDTGYTGLYRNINVKFYANGTEISGSQRTLRSDTASYNLYF